MPERIMLVTGATDGIGRRTALNLARAGAKVLVHGRDPGRVRDVVAELQGACGAAAAEGCVADLASLAQVRRLAEDLRQRCGHLDVLLHNAGVFMKHRQLTEDALETTFQVNHLAPFLLTALVQDLLAAAPAARVVTVSSVAHTRGRLQFDNLQAERDFDGYGQYAMSKLANVLFAVELAGRTKGTRITSNALHPGVIGTKLLQVGFGMGGASLEEGARTSTWLALSDQVAGISGGYFADNGPQRPAAATEDAALRLRLWEHSARLAGLPA